MSWKEASLASSEIERVIWIHWEEIRIRVEIRNHWEEIRGPHSSAVSRQLANMRQRVQAGGEPWRHKKMAGPYRQKTTLKNETGFRAGVKNVSVQTPRMNTVCGLYPQAILTDDRICQAIFNFGCGNFPPCRGTWRETSKSNKSLFPMTEQKWK